MVSPLRLGWIDYSSEHRNKVMTVLDLLTQKGAVDELGIGQIRDGFSDMFFPGTSTLQTRAKYFFIVPYLLMELEKESISNHSTFMYKLSQEEINLIEILKQGDDLDGIIGGRSGNKLKRKPSSIYWNGLRKFEIFKYEKLSLDNYAKSVINLKKNKQSLKTLGDEEVDDSEVANEHVGTFWHCLLPEKNWKGNLTIHLTKEEAEFLKKRITLSSKTEHSLFAYLLQQYPQKVGQIESFEMIGDVVELPDHIREVYKLAKDFSKFISGANIRYNVILSHYENEVALEEWEKWKNSSFVKEAFSSFSYLAVTKLLGIGNVRLKNFLRDWQQAVINENEEVIDQLIIKREIELKSKDRAKLNNSKAYSYDEGWIGSKLLGYRFKDAQAIMKDIFDGLGDDRA
ncbi:hypothetical protein SAMN05216389_10168 [Oceanobacillus limi]|uniref:Uncharacterized protein n=1 Tax=Oceanobacillus limi TaxID=930131 RepID=A0A1H9Y153_9BACI|nr:DUF6361 family protein [Oceanobacillus limi]SES61960.1 hypothetical protein SAMN05216389_10168 [Oceanobacillus limi]